MKLIKGFIKECFGYIWVMGYVLVMTLIGGAAMIAPWALIYAIFYFLNRC